MNCAVDLNGNLVNGVKVYPKMAEFAHIIAEGPVVTDVIIRKLYGLCEPANASNSVKQLAYGLRKAGIPVHGARRLGGYWIG